MDRGISLGFRRRVRSDLVFTSQIQPFSGKHIFPTLQGPGLGTGAWARQDSSIFCLQEHGQCGNTCQSLYEVVAAVYSLMGFH